ncbi:MAG: transporter substrate-binding domain-containing protein [Clostridia bacterium]|nr:transporter substrate-binding domain-containing protein [Clostridia bacterium]
MMIRYGKKITAVIMALITVIGFVIPVCASEVPNEKTVRVAYFESENFMEGASDEAVKSGYAYETLHEISNYTGWKYEYVYGEWAALYEMFLCGEIDLFPGLAKREDRKDSMDWPDHTLDVDTYSLFVREDDASFEEADPEKIYGKKIGLVKNNIADEFLRWAEENNVQVEEVYYDDVSMLLEELDAGNIDAFAGADNSVDYSHHVTAFLKIADVASYIAVRKGADDLLSELNYALAQIENFNHEFYKDLRRRYYNTTVTNATLTGDEENWIDSHRKIVIGYADDYLPFSGTDLNGKATGIMTEIASQIVSSLELEDRLEIEYVAYADYDKMLRGLENEEVDVVFPVMTSVWHAEKNGMMQTDPIVYSTISAVFKGSLNKEKFDKVAIVRNASLQEAFVRELYPHSEIVWCDNMNEALSKVESEEVGATFFNSSRTGNALVEDYDNLSEMGVGKAISFSLGVKKGNTLVYSILNRGLSIVNTEEFSRQMYEYVENRRIYTAKEFLREHALEIVIVVATLALIILCAILDLLNKTKKAESDLKRTDDIISDAEMGIWRIVLFDGEKPRMRANSTMLKLLALPDNITDENLVYEHWFSHIKPEALDSVIASVEEMQAGMVSENTYLWIHPELGEQYVRCGGKATRVEDRGWVLQGYHYNVNEQVLRDQQREIELSRALRETEKTAEKLREALEAAKVADKAKTDFLFSMSHDIRTPMNVIIGYTNLVKKNAEDAEQVKNYTDKIQTANTFLLSLINNVLEMARIESGKMTLEEKNHNAYVFNKSLIAMFEGEMETKGIAFDYSIKVNHPEVMVDETKIREIFLNILSNAVKYTPSGGKVSMHTTELESESKEYALYRTVIEDTGIGMSEEFLPHIFDEFSREYNSTESRINGTGLGMPIVKKLVDAMGGTITVESEIGKGTEICVVLPHRIADVCVHNAEIPEEIDKSDFVGKRILLTEDNDLNAEIAFAILEDEGFEVDRACDGAECVNIIDKAPPGYYDLILVDIQMPKMNGYEATKRIRLMPDELKANIPIIAMTANAFDEDKKNAFESGMNNHLAKPIEIPKLMEALRNTLN